QVDTPDGSRPAIYAAAAKVIIDVLSLTFISSLAYGTATATLVSQSLGEERPDKAERYGWESAKLGFYVMAGVGTLFVLFPEGAMDLLSDDAQVITAGAPAMRMLGFIVPIITLSFVFTQALFGAGNTTFVMIVEALLHILCLVPLTWLLAITFDLGFIGPWIAASVYIVALATIMGWKFWTGDWKAIKV
ncbi:MAG: MATE family efflux transporter, partial [Myxococcota bacterium]